MANSTKITKSLTIAQMDFLRRLDDEEIQLFTLENIRKFTNDDTKTLNEIIENLVKKEFLHRLERGKYCRSTFRDENVIGTFVSFEGVIAYWSALNLHGLTEQFSNTIFVQTVHLKKATTILGTSYQFVKIRAYKRAGVMYNGYGDYKYPITDVEKTIVDCFDLPQYSGGYSELIRAFARAKLDVDKLMNYCMIIDNSAVTKRLGFLAELLEKENLLTFIKFARTKVTRTCNEFDPFGKAVGDIDPTWHLRLNVSKKAIKEIIQNPY